jgi:outer membrane protein assembly factor BamA
VNDSTDLVQRTAFLAVLALSALLVGCLKKDYPPARDVVSRVDVVGGSKVDEDDVEAKLATTGSSKFLGIWEGVIFDYEVFDENVLARDLERVERYYRSRGFYEAKVRAGRIIRVDGRHVRVEVQVEEGPQVFVREVDLTGIAELPFDIAVEVWRAQTMKDGDPFDEETFEEQAKRIAEVLGDEGYAFVEVKHRAKVDLFTHTADVSFEVIPGEVARYGPVRINGLRSIPEGPVRAVLAIREGRKYSRQALVDARDALQSLGVFASVEVREDKGHPDTRQVPITVIVQEAALRTVRLGGGARFDVLRLDTHLRIGWEHRNFLGGMRSFDIEARPGVTYFPTRIGRFVTPTRLLPENRIDAILRQPSFIEGRTTGFIAGDYNIYPLLYPIPDAADPQVERIIGYQEVKASVGLERAFWRHHIFMTPSYNWQAEFPFAYQGEKPGALGQVRVSYPELYSIFDFRDDRLEPRSGFYFSNSVQVAGFVFGGTVSDVRVRPEARVYIPLTRNKKFVLATRVTSGFLFPHNYGETLKPGQANNPTDDAVISDQQKLLFRAFYSGGPNSNRGYPYRGVGPHGPVGFLVPTGYNCDLSIVPLDQLPAACIRPLGGLTLWEASLEVRFPITGPLLGATFVDSSDVTRNVGEIRLNVPHISPGLGIRYQTPVGPVRFDLAYRVPGLQQIGSKDLPLDEGNPGTVFGLPIAINIALGEAY